MQTKSNIFYASQALVRHTYGLQVHSSTMADNKSQAVKFNQQASSAPPLAKESPSQKVGKSKKSGKKAAKPPGSPSGKSTSAGVSASCFHCQHANNGPPQSAAEKNANTFPLGNQPPPSKDDNVKKLLSIGKLVSNKFSAVMELQRELERKLKLCLSAKSEQQKSVKASHDEHKAAHPEVKGADQAPKNNSEAPAQGAAVNANDNVDAANARKSQK